MEGLLEKLHIKTITLALVLAAGLCWPVLYITQIEPRDRDLKTLEKQLAEIKTEFKVVSSMKQDQLKPYKEQIRILNEENIRLKSQNQMLEVNSIEYKKTNKELALKNSILSKRSSILGEIRDLQKKKDNIESSISFHQSGDNSEYKVQLKRQSQELQQRMLVLQEKISSIK